MSAGPQVVVDLSWKGDLRFAGRSGGTAFTLDSDGQAGLSPVEALAASLAGCMAIDVVHILRKSRLPVRALHAHLEGRRAPEDPRRLMAVNLSFEVEGEVPGERVERAIALSRDKYCSVWHSLNPNIALETSYELKASA